MTARDLTPSAAVGGEGADIVRDLAKQLAYSISRLGYPVGLGQGLNAADAMKAAQGIVDLYAHRLAALQPSSAADAKPVAWRYRYPTDEAWQLTQDHDQAFKNTGEVEPLAVIPFAQPHPSQQAAPHCQLCGGDVEGWICQTCEADFEEVGGLLILKSDNTHAALRKEVERLTSQQAGTEEIEKALRGALEWDKARGYRMPYRVRDPIYAVLDRLAALKTVEAG